MRLAQMESKLQFEVIEAATINGTLSDQGRYDAHFIALENNLLIDISILAKPKNITHLWKGGKLFKAPGLDSWDLLEN